jgi:hypothetical protein
VAGCEVAVDVAAPGKENDGAFVVAVVFTAAAEVAGAVEFAAPPRLKPANSGFCAVSGAEVAGDAVA